MKNIKFCIGAFLLAFVALISFADDNAGKNIEASFITSQINPKWDYWKISGYNFGVDNKKIPVPIQFGSQIMTNSTIMVRGEDSSAKRWGYHCFEAYADDDMSRITMLVNKHVEEGKSVAELYYYGTKYNHSALAYNWFKIGSDVRGHSFMFSRDNALFYGSLEIQNTLTLDAISPADLRTDKPKGDDEINFKESAKFVKYSALKNAKDGTLYFDKDKKAVVVKVCGKWWKLEMTPLDDYDICAVAENGKTEKIAQIKNPERLFVSLDSTAQCDKEKYCKYQKNLADLTENEENCQRARMYQNVFDDNKFIMYAEFDNDLAVSQYLKSPKVKASKRQCAQRYPSKKSKELNYQILPAASDDSKLVIAVEFNIAPDMVEKFLQISKPLRDGTNTEADTLSYELYRDPIDSNKFFLFELYKNRAAHSFHSKQPYFVEWNRQCMELGIKRFAKFWDISEIGVK